MENVVLYSNGCPKCIVIKNKLKEKNISFTETDEKQKIIASGYMTFPVLEVDSQLMGFVDANNWINTHKDESINKELLV